MQTQATQRPAAGTGSTDRTTVAEAIERAQAADMSLLSVLMENPAQDALLLDGLHLFLDRASQARFLHTLKLEQRGLWFGNAAPSRLQVRLTEAARSSQHAAYLAFRAGLTKSGGLERAFPKV